MTVKTHQVLISLIGKPTKVSRERQVILSHLLDQGLLPVHPPTVNYYMLNIQKNKNKTGVL